MPKATPILTRDQMVEHLKAAVRSQIYSEAATISAAQIKKQLMEVTADQRRLVIQGLLGVDGHWGEVRLYQTNGHVTELQTWAKGVLGDELRVFVEQAARDAWDDSKGELKAAVRAAVKKHVKECASDYRVRSIITDAVHHEIHGMAKDIMAEVVAEVVPKMSETA